LLFDLVLTLALLTCYHCRLLYPISCCSVMLSF